MRKLLLTIAALLLLAGSVFAADSAVTALDTQCQVAADGSCTVQMQAQLSLAQPVSSLSVPVDSQAKSISVSGYKVRKTKAQGYTLLTLTGEGDFSGNVELAITYRLTETVTVGQDGSHGFSLSLLSPGWEYPIQAYTLSLQLPKAFTVQPEFQSGYYGDRIADYLTVDVQETTILATATQALKDHEAMSVTMTLPGEYFDLRFLPDRTAQVDRVGFWVLVAAAVLYWLAALRTRLPRATRQNLPPEGSSPGTAGFILAETPPDLALALVHWASLGYLTLRRTKKGIVLEKLIDMGNERKPYEVSTFTRLFRLGDTRYAKGSDYVALSRFYSATAQAYWGQRNQKAKRGLPWVLQAIGVGAGLFFSLLVFDHLLAPQSWRWLAIVPLTALGGIGCLLVQNGLRLAWRPEGRVHLLSALLGLIYLAVFGRISGFTGLCAACVALQLLIGGALSFGGPRTSAGYDRRAALLGYRRYLRKAATEEHLSRLEQDGRYLYLTLPYAQALGVGPAFVRHFSGAVLEPCDWLTGAKKPPKRAAGFYRLLLVTLEQLRGQTAARPQKQRRR